MALNDKLFEIMYGKLYSDKELANVRELSCNAKDAHIDAGTTDTLFEVHLPNTLEPYFGVKDFGTGLTPQQMIDIYTVFGESTKDGSNATNGALGLGCKTPFAMTDQFTISSRVDGKVYHYIAFKGDDRLPTLSDPQVADTLEPNGLTIRVPIDPHKFHQFSRSAASALRPLVGSFKITGEELEIAPFVKLFESDNGFVEDGESNSYRSTMYAWMGDVIYPIDLNQVNSGNQLGWKKPVYLHFDIGDLDIAASREELGYDKKTIEALDDKIAAFKSDMVAHVTKEVAESPSRWAALQDLGKVSTMLDVKNLGDVMYRGKPIRSNQAIKLPRLRTTPGGIVHTEGLLTKEEFRISKERLSSVVSSSNMVTPSNYVENDGRTFHFFYLDNSATSRMRIKKFLMEKGNTWRGRDYVVLFRPTHDGMTHARAEKALGIKLIAVSSLARPEREKKEAGCKKTDLLHFQGNARRHTKVTSWFKPIMVEEDLPTKGYYFEIKRFDPTGTISLSRITDLMEVTNKEIYAVRKGGMKYAKQHLKPIEDLVKNIERISANKRLAKAYVTWNFFNMTEVSKVGFFSEAMENHPLFKTWAKSDRAAIKNKFAGNKKVEVAMKHMPYDQKTNDMLRKMFDQMLADFPLIKLGVRYYMESPEKAALIEAVTNNFEAWQK